MSQFFRNVTYYWKIPFYVFSLFNNFWKSLWLAEKFCVLSPNNECLDPGCILILLCEQKKKIIKKALIKTKQIFNFFCVMTISLLLSTRKWQRFSRIFVIISFLIIFYPILNRRKLMFLFSVDMFCAIIYQFHNPLLQKL